MMKMRTRTLNLDVGKHGEQDDSHNQVSKDDEMKKSLKDNRPGPQG